MKLQNTCRYESSLPFIDVVTSYLKYGRMKSKVEYIPVSNKIKESIKQLDWIIIRNIRRVTLSSFRGFPTSSLPL